MLRFLKSKIVKILLSIIIVVGATMGIFYALSKHNNKPEEAKIPEVEINNINVTHESHSSKDGSINYDIVIHNKTPNLVDVDLNNVELLYINDNPVPGVPSKIPVEGENTFDSLHAGEYKIVLEYEYLIKNIDNSLPVDKTVESEPIELFNYKNNAPTFSFDAVSGHPESSPNSNDGQIEVDYTFKDIDNSLSGDVTIKTLSGPTNIEEKIDINNSSILIKNIQPGTYNLEVYYKWSPGDGIANKESIIKYNEDIIVDIKKTTRVLKSRTTQNFILTENISFTFWTSDGYITKKGILYGSNIFKFYVAYDSNWKDENDNIIDIKNNPEIIVNELNFLIDHMKDKTYYSHYIKKLKFIVFYDKLLEGATYNSNEIRASITTLQKSDRLYDGRLATMENSPDTFAYPISHEMYHHLTIKPLIGTDIDGHNAKKYYNKEEIAEYFKLSTWNSIPGLDVAETAILGSDDDPYYSTTKAKLSVNDYNNGQKGLGNFDAIAEDDPKSPKHKVPLVHTPYKPTFYELNYLMSFQEMIARDLTYLNHGWNPFSTLQHNDAETSVAVVDKAIRDYYFGGANSFLDNNDERQELFEFLNILNRQNYSIDDIDMQKSGGYDLDDVETNKENTLIKGSTTQDDLYDYVVFENEDEIIKSEINYYTNTAFKDASKELWTPTNYGWYAEFPYGGFVNEPDHYIDIDSVYDIYFLDSNNIKYEATGVTPKPMNGFDSNYVSMANFRKDGNLQYQIFYELNMVKNGKLKLSFTKRL